jgi:hypothetical protein
MTLYMAINVHLAVVQQLQSPLHLYKIMLRKC